MQVHIGVKVMALQSATGLVNDSLIQHWSDSMEVLRMWPGVDVTWGTRPSPPDKTGVALTFPMIQACKCMLNTPYVVMAA